MLTANPAMFVKVVPAVNDVLLVLLPIKPSCTSSRPSELVKYSLGSRYSIVPCSAVVKRLPVVNFKGAVPAVAVPALICITAVGVATPKPASPTESMFILAVPFVAILKSFVPGE